MGHALTISGVRRGRLYAIDFQTNDVTFEVLLIASHAERRGAI
jgi:hypothetical protein